MNIELNQALTKLARVTSNLVVVITKLLQKELES